MNSNFYFRTLHEAGPELKRTISGNLDEQEVIYLLKTDIRFIHFEVEYIISSFFYKKK